MSVALAVMVKDEAPIVGRLLDSVEGSVDAVIALDTGSSDGTPELLAERGATVHRAEFEDFGRSRTLLMQLALGRADWLLLLDADMELGGELPELDPAVDAWQLEHLGGLSYWVPRLVSGRRPWQFVGATHEYLDAADGLPYAARRLEGAGVVHHGDGHSRAEKCGRDRALLERELAQRPDDARATFYLGATLRDMGLPVEARAYFQRRAALAGFEEEAWLAQLEAARIARDEAELLAAWARRPWRAEPLADLVRLMRSEGRDGQADSVDAARASIPIPPDDVLFIEREAYGERTPYSGGWFERIAQGCRDSAAAVAPLVLRDRPETVSVIDVGCGQGWWGAAFRDLGCDVVGIDGDWVRDPAIPFAAVDLAVPGSLDEWADHDLALCLEVGEHLPEERADSLVDELCRLGKAVLWSAAIPGQPGNHHVNCQWPDYWAEKFARGGYRLDDALRNEVWDDARIEPWYRQNLMLATRGEGPAPQRLRHPDCPNTGVE